MMNDDLHVVHARAAGLDVHKLALTATVRLCATPPICETRTFSALPSGLEALVAWLTDNHVEVAALEGTGVYWQASWRALTAAGIEAQLAARAARAATARPQDRHRRQPLVWPVGPPPARRCRRPHWDRRHAGRAGRPARRGPRRRRQAGVDGPKTRDRDPHLPRHEDDQRTRRGHQQQAAGHRTARLRLPLARGVRLDALSLLRRYPTGPAPTHTNLRRLSFPRVVCRSAKPSAGAALAYIQ